MKLKNYAVILASGLGSRFLSDLPKQFAKIAGKTVMEHTIKIFEESDKIDEIILVVTPLYQYLVKEILLKNNFKKIKKILNGGETRQDSSAIGVNSITDKEANVIIHDCARPFLSHRIIDDCVEALKKYDAIDVAIPSADTIIEIEDNIIIDIPERDNLRRGQTPQCFKLSLIKKAHEIAKNDKSFTDDCGIIVKNQLAKIFVVNGDNENIKITYPNDIDIADKLFQTRNISLSNTYSLENLNNKVIVVFGGTSGIGKSIVDLAIKYNAKVFPLSLSIGCDIKSYKIVEENLSKIYSETGKIDYVVNSAGILKMGKLTDRSIDDIKEDIEVNYIGSINVAKASIPYLKETNGGLLFFTSSSYTRGRALYSIYSSTKAGISNLTQALAEELVFDKVRVNAISPERTATPMRLQAFGKENNNTLLDPKVVAKKSLEVLVSDINGEIVSIRKSKY